MTKINSKSKGSRFERSICKFFTKWTGYEFNRVPASGGLRWKKADNITSDVTCTDPKHSRRFPLSIECKSYKDLRFEHILLRLKSCKILSFWEQASGDASRANKIPVLIMKYNNMPKDEAFFMVDQRLVGLLTKYSNRFKSPYMVIQDKKNQFGIFMLSDIGNLDYSILYKEIRNTLK